MGDTTLYEKQFGHNSDVTSCTMTYVFVVVKQMQKNIYEYPNKFACGKDK